MLEGYIDLLVRTPAGLVIVDYKTDQWRPGADQDGMRTVEGITHATGEPTAAAATGADCGRRPAGAPMRSAGTTSSTERRARATTRPPLPRATARVSRQAAAATTGLWPS